MNILFITSTRIGDGVLSTGLVDHLCRTHPDARITVAAGEHAAPLFEAAPNVERVIVMVKQRHAGHWLGLWREAVFIRWDMVIDLRRSAISWLLSARRRYILKRTDEQVHRVRQLGDLFDLPEPPAPHIWTTARHDDEARRLIPDGRQIIAIGPVTNWRAKTWRPACFIELVERLTGTGGLFPDARVAVFGGPDEREDAHPVLAAIPVDRRIDLVGTIDLLTAVACLKRCAIYIGNDSAVMHLAAAAEVPTVGLFGPSNERHYAPWGFDSRVVRTRESFETIFPADFDHRTSGSLMDSLTVDAVETAVNDLWQDVRQRAA
ncbi:MAG: glycosyltransferase family 9 protein [Rhodospirillales bacterium]